MTRERFMELSKEAGLEEPTASICWNQRSPEIDRDGFPEELVMIVILLTVVGIKQIDHQIALAKAVMN